MRRKITAGAIAGAAMLAGALAASPASADAVQSGCHGTSFKLYSSTAGYCFNGLGYSSYFGIWGVSIQSDSYTAGALQIQDRWSGNWFWWGFGYQQTSDIDNNPSGFLVDQVYLASID